jgi:hypothetical protein
MTPLHAQSNSDTARPAAVRLSTETVVCNSCGCRLTAREPLAGTGLAAQSWYHFEGQPGRDARGCIVDCADAAHVLN